MTGHPLLTDAVRAAIAAITGRATIRDMARQAAETAGIPMAQILGPSRLAHLCRVREVIWYRAWAAGFSQPQIARVFRRDHTTVMSGIRNEERRRGEPARPASRGKP